MVTQSKKHTPTNFDPLNYEVIAWFDNMPPHLTPEMDFLKINGLISPEEIRKMMNAHQARRKVLFPDGQDSHHCQHCGQHIRYVAVGRDKRDGKNVPFGEICAMNRLSLPDRAAFEREFIHTEANRQKKEHRRLVEKEKARVKFSEDYPEFLTAYESVKDLGFNGFVGSIIEQFEQRGKLSPAQVEAFLDAAPKAVGAHNEREQRRRQDAESSEWRGAIGERLEITGQVEKILNGEGYYGTWYLTIIKSQGDVITYFNRLYDNNDFYAQVGDVVTFKATVKEHEERDGVKQTKVQRASKCRIVVDSDIPY